MNGEWKFYYNSGKIKGSGKFLNGDGGNVGPTGMPINGREGIWIVYHENGKKLQESSYVQGEIEGKFIRYYENGLKESERVYLNGTKDFEGNLQTEYKEDGSIKGKFEYKNGKWEEQLTPEERFARMQKQVEEMNEKADKLAERIKNQADNNSRNSSYTKIMCSGRVQQVDQLNKGYAMAVEIRCPHCKDVLGDNSLIKSRQSYSFGKQDPHECDEDEFECKKCGKVSIMKPCLIKHLNRYDEF